MPKRRRWLIAGSAILALLLTAGAAFYMTGGYEEWRDDRSVSSACEGVVSKQDAQSALGSRRIYTRPEKELDFIFGNMAEGRITKCVLKSRDSGENVVVQVSRVSGSTDVRAHYAHQFVDTPGYGTVPVGGGWRGSMVFHDDSLQGSVELACRNQKDRSLLVSARTLYSPRDEPGLDSQQRADDRAGFARLLTSTASAAADKYDCDASLGRPVDDVAPDPVRNPVPLDKAKGICAPVAALRDGAGRVGAVSVTDAPTDPTTPAEDCYLNDAQGTPLYRLTALYGPLADMARAKSTDFDPTSKKAAEFQQKYHRGFGSAQCGAQQGRAFYRLGTIHRGVGERTVKNPDVEFERAALKAFAEQSAKTHGCDNLQLP
ncbi:hypothetical protein [Streptomyces albireticuli]|uniref:Uncharacterized protein n=1 Tax=Streptomyces albireticuli TaxID=1940 RepID=A0A2A2D8C7_9ACTN|nr:hypothetical protein [Streptomyces albireticuli]PAU47600.1 hypothetical protein CK936_17815 [Streptomyces albireticuli]